MVAKSLSIAGFDGSGGAGIQADLKTFCATGSYGMTVLTSLAVQNTVGVRNCYAMDLNCIEEQLQTIFDDIIPDAIKIGMLYSSEIIECVAGFLKPYARKIPIILDPVMVAKSGDLLLKNDAIDSLKKYLVPLTWLITPNLPEATCLIPHVSSHLKICDELINLGCQAVLLKGGHMNSPNATDLFRNQAITRELQARRINTPHTHGTGCTLSAAITSYIAQGDSLLLACKKGKHYLHQAILHGQHLSIGKGHGPVHHCFDLWKTPLTCGDY